MKRLLTFDFLQDEYVIQENNTTIFTINGDKLQFDSRKFYEGIYKGNSHICNIELINNISNDLLKKGNYIYQWITEIFSAINEEFCNNNEKDCSVEEIYTIDEINSNVNEDTSAFYKELVNDEDLLNQSKVITLYEIAACAGDGFFMDSGDIQGVNFPVKNKEADFAVKISGHSMEPNIPDGSIVLVKRIKNLDIDDIGIFNVNGEAMCKNYTIKDNNVVLIPTNKSKEFKEITITSDISCIIQGKVIEVINQDII